MRVAITGAAHGIGAAVATKLVGEGAEIAVFDIAEPVAPASLWIEVDLSNPVAAASAASMVDGSFDALINCAGLPPRPGGEAALLAVNTFGLIALTEAMLPKLAVGAHRVNLLVGDEGRERLDTGKRQQRLDLRDVLAPAGARLR